MELGRRQAVAGQEDWILDVALELARDSMAQTPNPRLDDLLPKMPLQRATSLFCDNSFKISGTFERTKL